MSESKTPSAPKPPVSGGGLAKRISRRLHGGSAFDGFEPRLPLDLQGWNSQHPMLTRLVKELKPKVVVDVGVWKGASVAHFCKCLERFKVDGFVIAVDTFLGSPEHWDRSRSDGVYESLRMEHGWPGLYWQFMSNIAHLGFQDRVVPLAQSSENAAVILRRLALGIDLVHIDAAHEYEPVLADARRYWPLVNPGGALVGDDFGWRGVKRAAMEFSAEIGIEMEVQGAKWVLRKPPAEAVT
ncbi:class I SAM-dependent methyltransferase [Acetobacteraceae bacterium H6797]|nr:class I SAM-dependent methyltransferase [Acetobacteraceae bacterium H6797]